MSGHAVHRLCRTTKYLVLRIAISFRMHCEVCLTVLDDCSTLQPAFIENRVLSQGVEDLFTVIGLPLRYFASRHFTSHFIQNDSWPSKIKLQLEPLSELRQIVTNAHSYPAKPQSTHYWQHQIGCILSNLRQLPTHSQPILFELPTICMHRAYSVLASKCL